MHYSNLQILPTDFYLSIYVPFLPPDIKGLNVKRYLSLVVSTWSFSKDSLSAEIYTIN